MNDMTHFKLLQSFKSRIVCLLIFKVNQDSLGDVNFLNSQGVSFTEVQEGFIVRRGVSVLHLLILKIQSLIFSSTSQKSFMDYGISLMRNNYILYLKAEPSMT